MKSYRELQKILKQFRIENKINKKFNLKQKKSILNNEFNKQKNKEINIEIANIPKGADQPKKKGIKKKKILAGYDVKLKDYIDLKSFVENFDTDYDNSYPVIDINGVKYALNTKNKNKIFSYINKENNNVKLTGSDEEFINDIMNDEKQIKVYYKKYKDDKTKVKNGGDFFKYFHNLDMDLSKFDIYRNNEELKEKCKDTCFITALKNSNKLSEDVINSIRLEINTNTFSKINIKKVCEKYNFSVNLYTINHQFSLIGTNKDIIIDIALIDNHYFLVEDVEVTTYAIKNYDLIKNEKEWFKIFKIVNKKYYARDEKYYINSIKLVKLLLENKEKLLREINKTDVFNTVFYRDIKKDNNVLKYNETNTKEIKYKEKTNNYKHLMFADAETITKREGGHKPFMFCYQYVKNFNTEERKIEKIRTVFDPNYSAVNFLKRVEDDTLIIFHNMGYDTRFLLKHMAVQKIINKSYSKFLQVIGYFKNYELGKTVKINIMCSYAMIGAPIKNFKNIFELDEDDEKEILPYDLYTDETIDKFEVPIMDALEILNKTHNEEELKHFLKNIHLMGLVDGDNFNHIKYCEYYCKKDVEILTKGYLKFRDQMNKITKGLDIVNYITISSLGYDFLIKSGCLDGCYKFSGTIQNYISKFVVGGRTMTAENKKYHVIKRLADFDANALYPSSMYELEGFLKGKPQIIPDYLLNIDDLNKMTSYFVTVNIKKLNKNYKFPLLSKKNDQGIRQFENKEGIYYLDKISLNDVINFYNLDKNKDIEILEGYYFNDGRNYKIKEFIRKLYDKRQKLKKKKNNLQLAYKLLMNSLYGKAMLNPIEDETMIYNKDRFRSFINSNFHRVIKWTKLNGSNKYVVTASKEINSHFNSVHIACEILAQSKHIMNRVMCLAEDLNINIFYQDTDSMHIEDNKIELLSKEYKKKYNKVLIGNDMSQFSSDFDFKSDKPPVSVESYFLGKKSYIDKIECVRDNKKVYEYHARMKGVPNDIIFKHELTPLMFYNYLFKNNNIKLNLLESSKCFFESDQTFIIKNKLEFSREIKFHGKGYTII